jgi:protein phosphatase
LEALAEAVGQAEKVVRAATTLTAMLWSGSHLGLVHIGDSRAYVLRDGGLFRITHDHTWVQALVDEGRLSAEEAESHPKRALLARAIIAEGGHKPDLSVHDARPGDRYLLCSDGLSRVVPAERIRERLSQPDGPGETVEALIALAYEAGAPDNIACVVADVVAL